MALPDHSPGCSVVRHLPMGADTEGGLVVGRGVVLMADFCRATGLDEATVTGLLRSNQVEGLFDGAGRALGVFDDALPTAGRLRALGLAVRAEYDPENHRSYSDDGSADPDEPADSAWSWETDHHPARTAETVSSSRVYESPWLSLREDSVRRPDGSTHPYAVVDSPDAALIIAAQDGQLLLVEQYRYPIAGRSWEFPSGSADPQRDADPWALAARELREESGLSATSLTPLGTLDVLPSTLSQRCWVFLATELTHGPPDRDDEENDMESGWFDREHVERMIKDGHITDAKTCAAYTLLLLHEQARTKPSPPGAPTAPNFLRRRRQDM